MVLGAAPTRMAGQIPTGGSCTFPDETGKMVTWPNCVDPNEKPDPAKAAPAKPAANKPGGNAFPFPGEQESPTPGTPGAAAPAPQNPALPAPAKPVGNAFPFPGEPESPQPAAGDKPAPGLHDAGSSGTGSDDSSSSSSSGGETGGEGPLTGDDDAAARAAADKRAARRKLPAVPRLSPSEREDEDLKVAAFYQNDGDYKGAYARALDAVSIAADDPDAHFALAEAARKLGKLDEAETHYKKCLTLDPVPKERKAAEKALKEMAGG